MLNAHEELYPKELDPLTDDLLKSVSFILLVTLGPLPCTIPRFPIGDPLSRFPIGDPLPSKIPNW